MMYTYQHLFLSSIILLPGRPLSPLAPLMPSRPAEKQNRNDQPKYILIMQNLP
jgi:hypothetical protein